MKKILIIPLLLICVVIVSAQNLAQMAKQQIEKHVKLPVIVILLDTSYIRTFGIDKIVMELPVTSGGRIKTDCVKFVNPSITPINNLFLAATKKVKLPKEMISETDTLTVAIRITFDATNYEPANDVQRSMKTYTPAANPKTWFYEQEIKKQPHASPYWSYTSAMGEAVQILSASTFQQSDGGKGAPRFMVTISKED